MVTYAHHTRSGHRLRGSFEAGATGNHAEVAQFQRAAVNILEYGARE
jgi:hypothetical protein